MRCYKSSNKNDKKLEYSETINYLKIIKDTSSSDKDWWQEMTDEQKTGIERGLKDIDELI